MLTSRMNREKVKRQCVALNVLLSEYDEMRAIACRQTKLVYVRHDDDLYSIAQPTALSKTPSLTGPGVFGLGTRHTQKRANGKPL